MLASVHIQGVWHAFGTHAEGTILLSVESHPGSVPDGVSNGLQEQVIVVHLLFLASVLPSMHNRVFALNRGYAEGHLKHIYSTGTCRFRSVGCCRCRSCIVNASLQQALSQTSNEPLFAGIGTVFHPVWHVSCFIHWESDRIAFADDNYPFLSADLGAITVLQHHDIIIRHVHAPGLHRCRHQYKQDCAFCILPRSGSLRFRRRMCTTIKGCQGSALYALAALIKVTYHGIPPVMFAATGSESEENVLSDPNSARSVEREHLLQRSSRKGQSWQYDPLRHRRTGPLPAGPIE